MIIGPGFVIANPTKTGKESIEALAKVTDGMFYIRTNHMMPVPEQYADYDRHMMTRDPYHRLISIWNYIGRRKTDWGHEMAQKPFHEFVPEFLDARAKLLTHESTDTYGAPGVWIYNQTDNWNILCSDAHLDGSYSVPCYQWKLEEADAMVGWMMVRYGIEPGREFPRTNTADNHKERSGQRPGPYRLATYYVGKKLRSRVWEEWSGEDCRTFGYDRPF